MASFNFVPVLKLTTLLAEISIGCPVAGFRPVRAGRSFTDKLANPGNTMESPLARNSEGIRKGCYRQDNYFYALIQDKL